MQKLWSENPLPRCYAKPIRMDGITYLADAFGNSLPRETSIIELTRTPEDKARLANWRRSKGREANQIIGTATRIGKLGHRQIENLFNGENIPIPELLRPYWDNLLAILQEIHEIRLIAGNLFHFYEGYAGRVDCVARYYDLPHCAIAFKFSDRIKPVYDDIPLQLAAYCGALNRQYGEPYQVRIEHALLIVATPDEAMVTLFDATEIKKYWRQWQQRVAQFWAQRVAIA